MAMGNLVCGLLVVMGLAAVVAFSSRIFTVLRYAGAAYLAYLGIRLLLSRQTETPQPSASSAPRRVFLDGLLVALLNPKTLVFFAAFLPQFMDPSAPIWQGIVLVCLFVVVALITDTGYALAAARLAAPLQKSTFAQAGARRLSGGLLIALGILAASGRS